MFFKPFSYEMEFVFNEPSERGLEIMRAFVEYNSYKVIKDEEREFGFECREKDLIKFGNFWHFLDFFKLQCTIKGHGPDMCKVFIFYKWHKFFDLSFSFLFVFLASIGTLIQKNYDQLIWMPALFIFVLIIGNKTRFFRDRIKSFFTKVLTFEATGKGRS